MIASPKTSAPTEYVPSTVYAVVLFRHGEFRETCQFAFDKLGAEAFANATNDSRVNREITGLSAKLIEMPLVPEQVAAIEAAIEQAIETETRRGFRQ